MGLKTFILELAQAKARWVIGRVLRLHPHAQEHGVPYHKVPPPTQGTTQKFIE